MPTVTIYHGDLHRTIDIPVGTSLSAALQAAGVSLSLPCGGNHTCGKCRVWAEGLLSPPEPRELAMLNGASGQRLACFAHVLSDCTVRTSPPGRERVADNYRADTLPPAPAYPGDYGVAVDIGTTTVVGYLFARDSSVPLAVRGEVNRQRAYGGDVLSRIVYCNEHTVVPLRDVIRAQISDLLLALCGDAGLPPQALSGLVITGNTTMLHLLAGLEPRSLALAPFTPQSLFGGVWQLDLPQFPALQAYLPRCISSYVGADITCSILASGIMSRPGTVLLVDIGTNGEMALRTPDGLVCTSTAAGPAFEGAGISAGMSASSGAISAVWTEGDAIRYRTVDGAAPAGLCGSGLIDGIAALLELGVLAPSGRMAPQFHGSAPLGDSGVSITQGDVRQLQLAKGAIRGGMDTLLRHCGLSYDDLDQILLCGGFGSFMNVHSAQAIGLIPPGMAGRTAVLGNAAGTGAGYVLQHSARMEEAFSIAASAQAVELGADDYFKRRYVEVMGF